MKISTAINIVALTALAGTTAVAAVFGRAANEAEKTNAKSEKTK